jgi:hypothetical protein
VRPSWEPDFDFYESRFESDTGTGVTRVVLFLDMGAAAHAPVASHPVRLLVRIAMRTPREDGLRSEEESDALYAAEDAIAERVTKELDALYVGRVVAEGRVTFAFYVPQASAARAGEAGGVIGDIAPYVAEWTTEEDAAWAYYKELLYPDDEARKEMRSRRAADRILRVGSES